LTKTINMNAVILFQCRKRVNNFFVYGLLRTVQMRTLLKFDSNELIQIMIKSLVVIYTYYWCSD
jgi:hypothetical protein